MCIPNAVKYPQVAGHCVCEIQRDSLSAGVAVEGSDDGDDSHARDTILYTVLDSLLTVGVSLVKLKLLGLLKRGFSEFVSTFLYYSVCIVNDHSILVLTNVHIILTYVSPYLAATCFSWLPSSRS